MRRTSTTQRTAFRLPPPNAVTFTFQETGAMEISILDDSMHSHWHYEQLDTRSIRVVRGKLVVASGFSGAMGGSSTHMNEKSEPYEFEVDERIEWAPDHDYDERFRPMPQALMVDIAANEILHRNVCSMTLDYKIFPGLSSTPLWLKLLFRLLVSFPSARDALLGKVLRMQVILTLYAHDYHERHGCIPFRQLWFWLYPPSWTWRLEWRSMMWISYVVGVTCYWIGRLLFGMSAVYPEYTPVR